MLEPVPILSVSRLCELLREMLEDNFMQLRVEGEISNWSVPASGHAYFTLKDEGAQIRCVMFRPHLRPLRFRPENGMQAVLGGRMSLYVRRGEAQLIVETLEPRGLGGLQLAFEQLKERLGAEGLFDEKRKRPLPSFPQKVGVVTSATGAALQDILQVLGRRKANVQVVLVPVRVQGDRAAEEVSRAIELLNAHGECDVLIVGRGGGSLEDLWAFNEEVVARAIAASHIPVISAVGHEVDFSIADFTADLRAPTPSAAAELVARSSQELTEHLDHLSQRLSVQMAHRLIRWRERFDALKGRLRSPAQKLERDRSELLRCYERLRSSMMQRLERERARLALSSGRLQLLSPLTTLERGYSIVQTDSGRIVRSCQELKEGQQVSILFGTGRARARIESLEGGNARGGESA